MITLYMFDLGVIMSDIGERIKELRSEAGITQLQLGKYAGCTGQVISNIERGYTRPSAEVLNKIADSLHVPSDYILGISKSKWIASNPYSLNRCLQDRISSLLKKEQMTIESFAAAAELDQDEVSEIVFGGVQPNTDTLARISGTLHTTIDYLIGINEYEVSIESEEEKDIIQYFRKMSKSGKRIFMGMLEEVKDK